MRLPEAAKALQKGQKVSFRPTGNSMKPFIESGDLVTVAPASLEELKEGDIVLCKVGGGLKLHIIDAIKNQKGELRFKIVNAKGFVNGWTSTIYGKVVPTVFDEEMLKKAKRDFISLYWTLKSKITSVTYFEKGLKVNFVSLEAQNKFKLKEYKGIPIFKGLAGGN